MSLHDWNAMENGNHEFYSHSWVRKPETFSSSPSSYAPPNIDAGAPGIYVMPPRNQTVAITSNENITYECVVDGGRNAFCSVLNNPLEGDHTVSQFESIGIYKQDSPWGNSSMLIVSRMGREAYRNTSQDIKIRCRAFKESPPESTYSGSFYIIPYGESSVYVHVLLLSALLPILSLVR